FVSPASFRRCRPQAKLVLTPWPVAAQGQVVVALCATRPHPYWPCGTQGHVRSVPVAHKVGSSVLVCHRDTKFWPYAPRGHHQSDRYAPTQTPTAPIPTAAPSGAGNCRGVIRGDLCRA